MSPWSYGELLIKADGPRTSQRHDLGLGYTIPSFPEKEKSLPVQAQSSGLGPSTKGVEDK